MQLQMLGMYSPERSEQDRIGRDTIASQEHASSPDRQSQVNRVSPEYLCTTATFPSEKHATTSSYHSFSC